MDIEIDTPFSVGGSEIAEIKVTPISFRQMVSSWEEALSISSSAAEARKMFQRIRIITQSSFTGKDGKKVELQHTDLTLLPAKVGMSLTNAIDGDEGKMGSIVKKGDGITSSIIYKLGEPIKVRGSKDGDEIKELEFHAKTYGEVEDVLSAENDMAKVLVLLETVAKPVGQKGMLRMPGWAVDAMKPGDGVGIMQHVAPAF